MAQDVTVSSKPAEVDETDSVWTDMVEWLARFPGGAGVEDRVRLIHNEAGRGLVARGKQAPGTTLISIPNAALLNLRTLRPLYPPAFGSLNAVQWLSLHIALQFRRHLGELARPVTLARSASSASTNGATAPTTVRDHAPRSQKRAPIPQDKYWPFLASLPRSFPTVPLVWSLDAREAATLEVDFTIPARDASIAHLKRQEQSASTQKRIQQRRRRCADLQEQMPAAVRKRAKEVERRFSEDWHVVKKLWAEQKDQVDGDLTFFDFVRGWLNVNTRCIYFDIDGKRENNMTLCPVIDMINHSPGRTTKPDPRLSSLTFSAPSSASRDPPLDNGDELSFQYGSHEDAFLLAEYGFVVGEENVYNAIEIDQYIEALFDAQGDEGDLKRGILKDEGYWGDMTLQASPPAVPSWRVLVALRLLHHRLSAGTASSLSASALAPWYNIVSGVTELISSANEAKVGASWRAIAQSTLSDAEAGLAACDSLRTSWERAEKVRSSGMARVNESEPGVAKAEESDNDLQDLLAGLRMVRTVWSEQERISRAVLAGTA